MKKIHYFKRLTPIYLIAPSFLIMLLLYGYPICMVIIESFHKVSIMSGEMKFVGLSNFYEIIEDGSFFTTLALTFKYTAITVMLKISVGFIMAMFLNSEMYFSKTLKFLSLIPWAIQQVTVSIVWKWILDGNYGYLNYYLTKFGIIENNISWLSSPTFAFYFAVIIDTWLGISLISMIFLAGLSSIDKNLYESAMIDGAGIISRFKNITLPSVKNLILVTTALVTIWTFNSFNVIFVLTAGGPMRSTETLIIRIYQEAFSNFNLGVSSSLSLIATLILILLSLIYYKFSKSGEEV